MPTSPVPGKNETGKPGSDESGAGLVGTSGLIGAWMSGGVEWNIPHHHRASTFIPVQYKVEENTDGSKTVWVGELKLAAETVRPVS